MSLHVVKKAGFPALTQAQRTSLVNGGALLTSAQDMQPITDSARGMVNTVYGSLLNGK
jgi:hypothetical protein